MRNFEKLLKRRIREEVPDLKEIAPSLAIEVHRKGALMAHMTMGKTYRYYDLASLTKLLYSATAWMRWVSQSDFDLDLKVFYFLTWWRHRNVSVKELMTHTAGLNWRQPFYKHMRGANHWENRWPQIKNYLKAGRPRKKRKAIYSDLDLFLLEFTLEELKQKSQLDIWSEIQEELGLDNMAFHVDNRPLHSRSEYAPTEKCPWRRRVLQGEVHDEKAWSLGGIAPHSGLFSTIHDVSKWALSLRKALLGEETPFGSIDVAREFTGRQLSKHKGDWGYLFMKPSAQGASCGKYFSKRSFGHNGFTGTSLWIDPVKDLIVVILSNRVHPTRDNFEFAELRPKLHDWICELL